MVNRYLCDVFDEMRTADKTKNYSYLVGLIEEAQVLGNRMEAALYEQKQSERLHREIKEKKKELKAVEKDLKENQEKAAEMEKTIQRLDVDLSAAKFAHRPRITDG